ncbi:MAG: hypothetical protein AAF705_01215 [Bacteroidota bacterium]
MRELKELALMIDPSELRLTTNNLLSFDGDSKLASLYKGLVEGIYNSDDEAVLDLYPDNPKSSSYRKLKSTLKKRLKDAVLLFDERKKDYTDYQKAYYQCYKEWAVVKILLGQNAREAAVDVALGIIKKAQKFEFTDLVMDIASVLRLHYGARLGDAEKFNQYNKIFKQYRDLYFLEEEAQEAYIDLIINYVNNRSPKSNHHEEALAAVERLKPKNKFQESRQLQLCRFLIELMATTTVYDYPAALEVCNRAIDFFNKKPYDIKLPLQIFYYQMLVCHVQLGEFQKGKATAEKCLSLMMDGSFNWFKYQELYIILAFHTEEYEEAAQIFEKTTQHQRFEFLPDNVAEIWKIYQAYLYFLKITGKIKAMPDSTGEIEAFRLGKFLNEVMIFSKDKSGLNAAILIAQIMILISEQRYDESIDRIETTQQYCYRYLKTDHTQRTYLFLKMLLKVPHLGFDKSVILQKTQKTLDQLKAIPLEVANQAVEIEIIPYEKLWQYLLDALN